MKPMQYKSLLVIIIALFHIGCSSIKPASIKSGKNLYETFFVGEDGMQYYLKPLLFINQTNGSNLKLDITFRYKDQIKDSAILNFTIQSTEIFKNLDFMEIKNSSFSVSQQNIVLLFNEIKKNDFLSRFSTKTPLENINKLYQKNDWFIEIKNGSQTDVFKASNKTNKSIDILRKKLFILVQ